MNEIKANKKSIFIGLNGKKINPPNVKKLIQKVKASENQKETLNKLVEEIFFSVATFAKEDMDKFWQDLRDIQLEIEKELGIKNAFRDIMIPMLNGRKKEHWLNEFDRHLPIND